MFLCGFGTRPEGGASYCAQDKAVIISTLYSTQRDILGLPLFTMNNFGHTSKNTDMTRVQDPFPHCKSLPRTELSQ